MRAKGHQCITRRYFGDKILSEEVHDKEGWLMTSDWGEMD